MQLTAPEKLNPLLLEYLSLSPSRTERRHMPKMPLNTYRLEALLAIASVGSVLGVSAWQSTRKLSQADVDHYIEILEKESPPEMEDRCEFISRLRAWAENDDGRPIYMLNLMRFFDHLRGFPGAPTTSTPKEANAHYEAATVPMLIKSGGYPILTGSTTKIRDRQGRESNLMVYRPDLDNWDRILVVRYPGRRTFLELVTNPEYLKVMPYKLSALEVVLTPISGELVIPDLRWLVGASCLASLLLVGWIRAAHRNNGG
jgi:hypothetical protein